MDYAWEKLSSAAQALVGPKPIKQRLLAAYLAAHTLDERNFLDPEDRVRWSAIRERFTTAQDDQRGSIEASIDAMSEEMAARVAHDLIELLGLHTQSYVLSERRRLGG